MAKKTKTDETIRDRLLTCRLTRSEHEDIRQLSHDRYMSMGSYLYMAVREKLDKDMKK